MSKKKSYGQDTKEFQQAEREEEEFRRKKVSRKDEIIEVMKRHEDKMPFLSFDCIPNSNYETVATEIEKLYQAEGKEVVSSMKTEYVVQQARYKGWMDVHKELNLNDAEETIKELRKDPGTEQWKLEYRLLKRTGVDQIIS